ncbi:MAG: ribosomal protein S18-alanine N-acetyltransferase [Rhodobacteraceae bacterium]|nr:ribosomal protein S18-alanine N-acetyltransferase [Paracoccaceae bacterium]
MTPNRCAEIHAACFSIPRPWNAAEFADLLARDGVFLCESDKGFVIGRVAGPEAELLTLAVEPASQGHGLGRQLLEEFENAAGDQGACDLFLEVAIDNAPAIRLYETAGFQPCGQRKDYYASPKGAKTSAVVYKKQI